MPKFALIIFALLSTLIVHGEELFDKYHDNKELDSFISGLNSPLLKKSILAETESGNSIHLLKLSNSQTPRPALLILGDTKASSAVGTEILIEWISSLLKNEDKLKNLIAKNDIYIIPRPFPDSLQTFFGKVKYETDLNSTSVDDDGDLEVNEDGLEDLNEDGFITLIRIADDEGEFIESKDSPYLMVKSKDKNAKKFQVISEGIDNDKDELFNEDPAGGVNPNRNFAFMYPYFSKDAGTHQLSETETYALADFIFKHPEINLVFSFGDEDNLSKPWKEDKNKARNPIRSTIYKDDEQLYQTYSDKFKATLKNDEIRNGVQNPAGRFAHWIYYHFGRISLTTIPWQIPIKDIPGELSAEAKEIEWLKKNRPQSLVEWKQIKHPDFEDKQVEIGGVKPFYRFIPNHEECAVLAEKYSIFFEELIKVQPAIEVKDFKQEKLNNSLTRITLKIKNTGNAPLSCTSGRKSDKMYPLNVKLKIPEKWQVYNGSPRVQVNNLQIDETKELSWLILTNDGDQKINVDFSCPQINDFTFTAGDK